MRPLLVVLAALLLAPFTASAQKRSMRAPHSPPLSQVIHACVNRGGLIRIVAAPGKCGANQTPISWNMQGPPGPPGTPGEPGPQGPPGAALQVFDANGNALGLYGYGAAHDVQFFDEANAVMVSINGSGRLLTPGVTTFFATSSCSGTPYFDAAESLVAGILYDSGEQRLFAIETHTPPETVSISSTLDVNGDCTQEQLEDMPVLRGREVVLGLTFPIATPLYIGLPPQ